MGRGLWRLAAVGAAFVVLAGVVLVLFANARHKGKLSHCRNNLRRLGTMLHADRLNLAEQSVAERGRAFWQYYREQGYYNAARREWIRKQGLNPFGCPVLGRSPEDLLALSPTEYAQYMSDPATIDYAGPNHLPEPVTGRIIAGADRPGNHPSGGHALLVDLSVVKQDDAIDVGAHLWEEAKGKTID